MNKKGFLVIILLVVSVILLISFAGYFVRTKKIVSTQDSYVGVLSVTNNCMIPEGCGPKYKLLDTNLQTYVPLLGSIKEEDSELIIKVIGNKTTLPQSEFGDMNYDGPTKAIHVMSYSTISKIPYRNFLVGKADEFTVREYPCIHLLGKVDKNYYDKSFSWILDGEMPVLQVKVSGSRGYYELWYEGISGNFIKQVINPPGQVFCE